MLKNISIRSRSRMVRIVYHSVSLQGFNVCSSFPSVVQDSLSSFLFVRFRCIYLPLLTKHIRASVTARFRCILLQYIRSPVYRLLAVVTFSVRMSEWFFFHWEYCTRFPHNCKLKFVYLYLTLLGINFNTPKLSYLVSQILHLLFLLPFCVVYEYQRKQVNTLLVLIPSNTLAISLH